MALFTYKAVLHGGSKTGALIAESPSQARELLRQRGAVIQDLRPAGMVSGLVGWRGAGLFLRLFYNRPSREVHVVSFVRELSTLLAVGVPMTTALDTIIRQLNKPMRTTLMALRGQIAGGASLAQTMRQHGPPFDELTVSMVEVGETSGTLEAVLEQLASFKERSRQLKGKIGNALIYPCIVAVMAVLITLLLMTFVVPSILEPLTRSGKTLPTITWIVKTMSDGLLTYWLWLGIGCGLIGALAALAWRSVQVRLATHRAWLHLPWLGLTIRKQEVARIAIVISTLMRSGVHFLPAIEIAQRSTKNLAIRGALIRCAAAVNAGQDIADAMEATQAFPPAAIQIFAVGQQTGRLEEMLERLAADYDAQVTSSVQRFTSLLEPAMILLLAVMVGFIAFATILPILEAGHVL